MGNYLPPNEQQLYRSLQRDYSFDSHPILRHRNTKQYCTLCKIITHSQLEATKVQQIIKQYAITQCQSISRLRSHYCLDMRGYCSDEQNYYLIFDGKNNYTLSQLLTRRRLNHLLFSEQEIVQIIKVYVCGLRFYHYKFQRDYPGLSLKSIILNQQGKILLQDPCLNNNLHYQVSDANPNLIHTLPSPQKLSAVYGSKINSFSEFESNLFTVGVIGLLLMGIGQLDEFYSKKYVNLQQMKARVQEVRRDQLRKGLACLIDVDPQKRKNIYSIWQIQDYKQYYLNLERKNSITHTPNVNLISNSNKVTSDIISQNKKKFNLATNFLNKPSAHKVISQQLPDQSTRDSLKVYTLANLRQNKMQIKTTGSYASSPLKPFTITSNNNIYEDDSKPISALTTPQTVSSSIITSNPQPLPPISSISFKNFLANQAKETADTKYKHNLQQNRNLTNQNTSSVSQHLQNQISFNTTKQILNNHQQSKIFNQHQGTTLIPNKSFSINNIEETSNKQKFISQDKQSQNVTYNNVNPNRQKSPKKQQAKINPTSPVHLQSLSESINSVNNHSQSQKIAQHQNSPNRNQDKLIADYSAQNIQKIQQNKTVLQQLPNGLQSGLDPVQDNTIEGNQQIASTPSRPTTKHKYNSTIVQVHDQESVDQSHNSDQPMQLQYVVQQMQSGSIYEGFKSNGMRNGRGKFYYQDGGYYDGQWKNDQMNGYGKLYYDGGAIAYEGNWLNDQFNGLGKVYNDHPVPFTQPFDYTDFDLLDDYWQYYEGMLMNDTKQGRGKIKLTNGELFEGDFHLDRIQGFGKFYFLDGSIVEGIWRESKLIKVINTINPRN